VTTTESLPSAQQISSGTGMNAVTSPRERSRKDWGRPMRWARSHSQNRRHHRLSVQIRPRR
jgi:hypothetical protein